MTKTLTLPNAYQPLLDVKRTEICIKVIKELFEEEFSEALNVMEVSAPLLLLEGMETSYFEIPYYKARLRYHQWGLE